MGLYLCARKEKGERNWDDFRSSSQSTAMGKKKIKVGAFWDSGNEREGGGVTFFFAWFGNGGT